MCHVYGTKFVVSQSHSTLFDCDERLRPKTVRWRSRRGTRRTRQVVPRAAALITAVRDGGANLCTCSRALARSIVCFNLEP